MIDIKKLQEDVFKRNNKIFFRKKNTRNIKKNNYKQDWKDLYRGFKSAIERDNT